MWSEPPILAILCGGQGLRLSDDGQPIQKALATFRGRALIEHVLDWANARACPIVLNVHRHDDRLERWGLVQIPDVLAGRLGPLAGLHAVARRHPDRWIVCVPCDCPDPDPSLVAKLTSSLDPADPATLAVARCGDRREPLFACFHGSQGSSIEQFVLAGGRKVAQWQQQCRTIEVGFPDSRHFTNINRPQDLIAASDRTVERLHRLR